MDKIIEEFCNSIDKLSFCRMRTEQVNEYCNTHKCPECPYQELFNEYLEQKSIIKKQNYLINKSIKKQELKLFKYFGWMPKRGIGFCRFK